MRHTMRLGFVTVAMLMVITLLLACAPKPAEGLPPIRIGALFDITGWAPQLYQPMHQGLELALDEVGWEVAGRKIEIIEEDTAADPVITSDKARKVVEADKVDLVMGPLYFPEGVASYTVREGIPYVQYDDEDVNYLRFNNIGKCIYPNGTSGTTGYYLGESAFEDLGYRTAVMFYADFAYGQKLAEGFSEGFEGSGGKIIQRLPMPLGTMDFAPYITSIKKADCVAGWLNIPMFMAFLTQYQEYGLEMPIMLFAGNTFTDPDLQAFGPKVIGIRGVSDSWPYTPPEGTYEKCHQFINAYQNKYGTYPDFQAAHCYHAMQLVLEAAKATGGDMTLDKFCSALLKLDLDTIEGQYSFSDAAHGHLSIGDVWILEIVKMGDRYTWAPIKTFSQVLRMKPSDLELIKTFP